MLQAHRNGYTALLAVLEVQVLVSLARILETLSELCDVLFQSLDLGKVASLWKQPSVYALGQIIGKYTDVFSLQLFLLSFGSHELALHLV